MDKQTDPKGFLVVLPGEIIEIPQDSDKSWLTLFYSLPRELAEKWKPAYELPRCPYEVLRTDKYDRVVCDDMKSDFYFNEIEGVRLGDPVHIHSYDFEESEQKLNLSLHTRVSTDSEGIAKCLGLNAESKVELQDLIRILEPKLIDANRLKIGITG